MFYFRQIMLFDISFFQVQQLESAILSPGNENTSVEVRVAQNTYKVRILKEPPIWKLFDACHVCVLPVVLYICLKHKDKFW